MVSLSLLLVLVVVVVSVVVVAASRSSHAEGAGGAAEPSAGPGRVVGADVEAELDRWVGAGLLSREQSEAILAHERALAVLPAPPRPTGPAPPSVVRAPRRVPVVSEALGYLGGILAAVGLGLLVSRYWPDMATAARLGLTAAGAAAFVVAGFLVHEQADPAFARLRWFLWTASTAATALFVGVLTIDGFGVEQAVTIVLACAAAVTVQSGALWQWRERPLQQLGALGGLAVVAGAAVAEVTDSGPMGLAVWTVGAVYVLLGLRRHTPLPLLTVGVGAIAVTVGAFMAMVDWQAFGLVFAVLTASGLLTLAVVPGPAHSRADQILLALVGGFALLQSGPGAVGYFAIEAGIVTGLVVWVVGVVLVLGGARRLVRLPHVVEAVGGAVMIGGAAVTGVQSPAFASLFGIATAVGLIAAGTLPGQVLLSVFGSIGLLVNVPWAIGWFFPGEGRAPVLLLVSGALIVAVAVLLARMGGRFRRELGSGSSARTPRPPPVAA